MTRSLGELGKSETNSWGVIVNSFAELQNEYVGNLESFYKQQGAKAWCVGPLFLYHDMDGGNEPDETIEWLDEREDGSVVLSHKAIGGFLSHCGWNSVLESISCQVPILAWPMMAEQPLNARIVVDGFGIGMKVPMGGTCKVGDEMVGVGRGDICRGVDELMKSEKGMKAKEKARSLGDAARHAVQKDGSSFKCLAEFIDALTKVAIEER